ncbi:MAG: transcription elongation factor GreA [Clostridiales Family XIII bacterium]|jgi:transcription elongation factor GreA|nr:transcription elongation factor GreA [Clostridiales Family XIII bacterium]
MAEEEKILTRQGFEEIEKELEQLSTVRRHEVAEALKEARSFGDLSENAEYDAAKNEQAEIEARINTLENILKNAKVVEEDEIDRETVNLGGKIRIKNLKTKEESSYQIVSSIESDPFVGRLSSESIVGAALLGKKVGDKISVQVPDGIAKYQILEIL